MLKKVIAVLTASLIFQLSGFAQFSLYVFPSTVLGDPYADTILNTKALLKKEGIREIHARQTLPNVTKTFASKTIFLDAKGDIRATTICFDKHNDTVFCLSDTLLYDNEGRIAETRNIDNKGSVYAKSIIEYVGEREVRFSNISGINGDTLIDYKYFNEKGQVVRLKHISKNEEISYTSFFYNKDGLFDSIQYENSEWKTFVFKRIEKKNKKVIRMENQVAAYSWIYNLSGQCISSEFTRKPMSYAAKTTDYKGAITNKISYYYNADGTLAKVIQVSNRMPKTQMEYSYKK